MTTDHEHHCDDPESFPVCKFLQLGTGAGARVLIVGESLAPEGWRKSGKAFYKKDTDPEEKILPTGRNLNALLSDFGLSVDGSRAKDKCGFTDLVKCYVGEEKRLLAECGRRCWPIFEQQLGKHDFKLLILLGVDTLKIFNKQARTELRPHELAAIEVFGSEYRVLSIYHPSRPYLNSKNFATFDKLRADLEALLTETASQ